MDTMETKTLGETSIHDAIRSELEQTRSDYLRLLESIPEADYSKPTPNPAWNVGEVLFHISVALEYLPFDARLIRWVGWLPTPPAFIFHRFNEWHTRRGGRNAGRNDLAQNYIRVHERVLKLLAEIRQEEWDRGVDYPGWDPLLSGHVTLEQLFHYPAAHFKAHLRDLREALPYL